MMLPLVAFTHRIAYAWRRVMENSSGSNKPDFWNVRYAEGRTPWDFGGVPSGLKSFLQRAPGAGKVLIPGCGSGYEVKAFHDAGYEALAIDFSPAAVEQAKHVLGPLADRVILGDFFSYDFGEQRFDIIYERTFLCALTPARWPDYVNKIGDLLLPGGRLIGAFLHGQRSSSGPPFPISEDEAKELFTKRFQLLRSEPTTDSLPLFRDMERWQEWLKIDSA